MSKKIGLNDFLKIAENKEPFVVNYGKGRLSDEFIKDYPVWDEKLNAYREGSSIWSIESSQEGRKMRKSFEWHRER